jgi:7,8-dihydroneopterin aldolase/epimerase/oxygenase
MNESPRFDGLVPVTLAVASSRIFLDSLEVPTDIGFHDFEVGEPQRLLVSVEVWLADNRPPDSDDPRSAWDYDMLRREVIRLASSRRYNLQETLAHAIYDLIAARAGVRALRVKTCKPDIYPDAHGVGVEIASFSGAWPS